MPKLTLPNVEKIIDEAIGNILMRYKKNNLKDLLMLENFSNIINEIEEEAEKIYRNYERNAVEQYLRNKSLISKDIFTAIHTIIDNSLITSLANTRRARAGSSSQIILVKLLREKGIKCDVAKFKYKGYRPDIVIPSNEAFREDINKVYVLAVKRTLRERWAEDIDVFKFPNSAFILIKPDPDFTLAKAEDMVRRGMKRIYIPDNLYDKFKSLLNQLEEKYSVLFRPLSQLPNDLIYFLDKILINKRDV
jgi:hypothetical protein